MFCPHLQSLLAKQPAVTAGRPVVSALFFPSFGSKDKEMLPSVSMCVKYTLASRRTPPAERPQVPPEPATALQLPT